MRTTYIYIIESANDTFKVGISKDPIKRIKQLQTGNHNKLSIYQSYEIDSLQRALIIEKLLHQRLPGKKIGEWFIMDKEMVRIKTEHIINKCLDDSISLLKQYIKNGMI